MDKQISYDIPSVRTPVASFWSRIVAICIDVCILAAFLHIFAFLLFDWVSSIGDIGRILGFLAACLYFVFVLPPGQSIGKRIVGICVVDGAGNTVSRPRMLARTSILVIPQILNGVILPIDSFNSIVPVLIGVTVFGGYLLLPYYYIANSSNRRCLHDFIAGTYVVPKYAQGGAFRRGPTWLHYGALGVIALVTASILFFSNNPGLKDSFEKLSTIQRAAMTDPEVRFAAPSFNTTTTTFRDTISRVSYTDIVLYPRNGISSMQKRVPQIYQLIKSEAPFITNSDYLQFTIVNGYSLGFANFSSNLRLPHSIAQWDSLSLSTGE